MLRLFTAMTVVLGLSGEAFGVNCSTNQAGNWNNAAIWTGCTGGNGATANTPGTNDNVTIAHGVSLNGTNRNALSLTINSGSTLTTGSNSVTIVAGTGVLIVDGTIQGNGNAASRVIKNSTGNFSGAGTINNLNDLTIAADTTIATGTNLTFTGAECQLNLSANADVINNGTLIFNAAACATTRAIALANPATFTNNGSVTTGTVTGANATNSIWTNAATSTLNVSVALLATGTLTASAAPNTVNYNGAAQTAKVTTYNNLTLSGSGAKTFATTPTVNAVLSMEGTATVTVTTGVVTYGANATLQYNTTTARTVTAEEWITPFAATGGVIIANTGAITLNAAKVLDAAVPLTINSGATLASGNFAITIGGNWSNSGTFTAGTSVVTFNGTAAQTLGGGAVTTFNNLTMNNSTGLTLSSSVNASVASVLTLTSGTIAPGANTLIATAACPGSVSRTSGHIVGNLRLHYPQAGAATTTCNFPVGDATNYTPASIAITNVSSVLANNGLNAATTSNDHPNTTASPNTSGIDPLNSVNRYWTLTPAGAIAFANYSATFNYVVGDNDGGAIATNFVVAKGDTCSGSGAGRSCTTWIVPTAAAPGPSTTQASASGMTSFSDFAVGQRSVNNFLIGVPANPLSTCNAQSITITARNSANATITNYRGTVSLNTSTSDGDWSQSPASGTLLNGVADDGAATYAFVSGNNGVAALSLSNIKVDSDVTVTAVDITRSESSSNSTTMQFRGNDFIIANDAVQVAGRDQAMTVTRNRGSACTETLTEYAGSKNLKAWYTADTDHPSGAIAPAITTAAPAITTAVPVGNNLTRTFTNGVASFTLTSTDVGKYVINLRDDAVGTVNGTSPTITTRPFALVVSAIRQGATNNLGGTAASGSKFIAAADTMQATVGAYLWNSAADTSPADGAPDAAATLAQITAAGATPAYRWSTVLAAGSPFTPAAGTLGTLSNATQAGACPTGAPNCFTSGVATPTNLSYNEAGSFTLGASATNFLNSGINLTAIVFDNSGTPARSGVIGRFFPDHFTLLNASTVTPACSGGGFSYMGQPALGYAFTIEARNKSDVKTSNYASPGYTTGTVSMLAENNNSGTDLGSRLTVPGGSWSTGSYAVSTAVATFSRLASPDGPYDALRLGVLVTDADGPVLAARDMNPATSGDCVAGANCAGKLIGSSDTKARFGRLRLGGASGSQVLPLRVPVEAQYWNGSAFITNVADTCTTLATNNIGLGNYLGNLAALETTVSAVTSPLSSGRGAITLSAPGAGNNGSVDVTVNLGAGANADACAALAPLATAGNKAHLRGNWCNPPGTYTKDPAARARFGIMRSSDEAIYTRENTN